MHTMYSRLSTVFAKATTVLLVLLAAVACTSYILPSQVESASINITSLKVHYAVSPMDYERKERQYAFARFDIAADHRPLFNWNTKQLFLSVVAEYETGKYPVNQVVIWDRIVRRKKDAKFNITDAKHKYLIKDITNSWNNVTATFSLQYNVMPYVGFLKYGEAARTEGIVFPEARRQLRQ